MLDDFLILIGRFHPLIVHLPIGFIVLGILIELILIIIITCFLHCYNLESDYFSRAP